MELFNTIIRRTEETAVSSSAKRYAYNPAKAWEDAGSFELVMMRDAAFELGGDGKPAINYTCVTEDSELCSRDEIIVIGPELSDIKGSAPYARIAVVRVGNIDNEDTEQTFRAIQDIDFVKYRVFPKGYMIRTSSESRREQVRISKTSLKKGMSFEKIGDAFIQKYKATPNVEAVKLIFVTAPDVNYRELDKLAKQTGDIAMSLSKILEGMPTDCASCNLKPICDEVEGMRELHFGAKAK